ncbi:MAG: hypothetical protein P4N24_19275 [Acidobacteriota bacterium]|nr:hypothetical protein [Acidobacteriota bacterium]
MRTFLCAIVALVWVGLFAQAGGKTQFEKLGTLRALGGLTGATVSAGPGGQGERLYLSYLYVGNTVDIVSVDPDTGQFQVFPNPAASEVGARAMITGPDGKVYLGTLEGAHFYCLDPKQGKLMDLGRPSLTESYIWELAFGRDGKLYGVTYGQAKLVRYDPQTGALEDLGRMDPVEEYAHSVAGSDDGFVYVGIGTSKANVAAYQISTGQHREILPVHSQVVGQAGVHRGRDGKVYGVAGNDWYRLDGWNAIPIAANDVSPEVPQNVLKDGRTVDVSANVIRITNPNTGAVTERPFDYQGNELDLFRVAFGPDGSLYASSVLPADLVRFNPRAGAFENLGHIGGGEVYSLLPRHGRLLMAGYGTLASLMIYNPSKPFHEDPIAADREAHPHNPGVDANENPVLDHFAGEDHGWRPEAAMEGPDGQIYVGAVSGYGKLGGPLTIWNVATGAVEEHEQIVQNESVVTLTAAGKLIVGGTTIGGGGGSHPTEKEAKLFLWDTAAHKKIFETVPVADARGITDLIAVNGRVFGMAGRTLFVFDPLTRQVIHRSQVDFSAIYNSVAVGPDGKIWGLSPKGIFQIDPATYQVTLVASAPGRVTAGFAMDSTGIYYASHCSLYRYTFR